MKQNETIKEIVYKECERYKLINKRFLTDRDEAVSQLCREITEPLPSDSYEDFLLWRKRLLHKFYLMNGYSKYATQSRDDIYILAHSLSRNIVATMRQVSNKKGDKTIDNELRVKMNKIDSVAFKLSQELFDMLYEEIYPNNQIFTQPDQIEDRCERSCQELFPLSYKEFYDRLIQNDSEFWSDVWSMIRCYVNLLMNRYSSVTNRQDTELEITSETAISIQDQINRSKFEGIESAEHLLNSIHRTCSYKCHETFNAKMRRKEDLIEDKKWITLDSAEPDPQLDQPVRTPESYHIEESMHDADASNNHAAGLIMIKILQSRCEPFFSRLCESDPQKVNIFLKYYFDEETYEEIAQEMGLEPNPTNKATLRKSASRIKDRLLLQTKVLIKEVQQSKTRKNYSYEKSV